MADKADVEIGNKPLLPPKGNRVEPPGNMAMKVLCCTLLPFRWVPYILVMGVVLPLTMLLQCIRAPIRRCCSGKPSDILHKKIKLKAAPMPEYVYQLVLKKPIEDVAKLRKIIVEQAAEFSIPENLVEVIECKYPNPKVPNPNKGYDGSYYTGTNFMRESMDKRVVSKQISVKVYNAPKGSGKATVLMGQGNVNQWDGSSNFNFAKEYLSRYVGNEKNKINMAGEVEMSDEAKDVYDNQTSFWKFLFCQLPYATIVNMHGWAWFVSSFSKCCGGNGFNAFDNVVFYNLNEEDSKAFALGCKKFGMKPFAALVHSGVDAHNQIIGRPIRRVCMQASLQSRCYVPKIERNAVGDWLVGPLQRIDGNFTREQSQKNYESLVDQLEHPSPDSEVAKSIMAKAYGGQISGAAMFEPNATYPYDAQLTYDALFFNNYGRRTLPVELEVVSWNWCAPMHLGLNCICVNGRTCCAFASVWMPHETTTKIRDVFEETMQEYIDAGKKEMV